MNDQEKAALFDALREICAIAPPCSEESVALSEECTCGRTCRWRDRLRDVQRIARVELKRLGGGEA